MRSIIDAFFNSLGVNPRVTMEADGMEVIKGGSVMLGKRVPPSANRAHSGWMEHPIQPHQRCAAPA